MLKLTNKLKTSLFSIHVFAVLPPPTKLELTLAGKVKEEQSKYGREWWLEGTYILADSPVNGYPYWLKSNGSQAIWFDKVASNWKVSVKENLGTNTGQIAGPHGKDSYPNEIKQGWRYSDGTRFHEVPASDVIFKAIGTVFIHSLYKINSTFFPSQNNIQPLSQKYSLQNQFSVQFPFPILTKRKM